MNLSTTSRVWSPILISGVWLTYWVITLVFLRLIVRPKCHTRWRICWWASAMLPRNALQGRHRQRGACHAPVKYWRGGEPLWRAIRRHGYGGTYRQWRSQRHRTGGERRRFQRVSGLRQSPVHAALCRGRIWNRSFNRYVAPHVFVVPRRRRLVAHLSLLQTAKPTPCWRGSSSSFLFQNKM